MTGQAAGRAAGAGVLAVGGSAGGVEALFELVAGLPADLPVPVVVTLHVAPTARSTLPRLLERHGQLPAVHAATGQRLLPGRIHVAPPDAHLVVDRGRALLSRGPRVNHVRPAVDVMLASAVRWAGAATTAVVLSGVLDDGAVGCALVAREGGRVLVQDPATALFPGMPRAALAAAPGAEALGLQELGGAAAAAVRRAGEGAPGGPDGTRDGAREGVGVDEVMADSDDVAFLSPEEGSLTRLSCPECSGVLAQVDLPRITYYRCHTGHQWGPQALAAAQEEVAESRLWTAVAVLDEQAALARHLLRHSAGAAPDGAVAAAAAPTPVEGLLGGEATAQRAARLAALLRDHLTPPVAGQGETGGGAQDGAPVA